MFRISLVNENQIKYFKYNFSQEHRNNSYIHRPHFSVILNGRSKEVTQFGDSSCVESGLVIKQNYLFYGQGK